MHIGMVQIFLEVHPLTVGDFARTIIDQLAIVCRCQCHYEIQIGATEIEAMSMTNAYKAQEFRFDSRFFFDFADYRWD